MVIVKDIGEKTMDKKIILYTIGCPMCNVLKKKLDAKGVAYVENSSAKEMMALGISSLPVLSVDGELYDFRKAVEWVNCQ